MPRKPKPKNTLSAGERVALYLAEQEEKQRALSGELDLSNENGAPEEKTVQTKPYEEKKAAPRSLPKPHYATVNVDLSLVTGEVKAMHGVCNGPVSYGSDISSLFREIGVPSVRFDSADGSMTRRGIDVSSIFPDMNADPSIPENYNFEYTDKYIVAAYNSGAEVILRFGESLDMLEERDTLPPESIDIWVHICMNILRHYNDYWAGGFAYGINRFEIWSSSGKAEDLPCEAELYSRLANAIKIYDDSLSVGGMCFGVSSSNLREFLKYCKKNRAPLDFITLECISGDVDETAKAVESVAMLLGNLGFDQTEIIIGKWCYIDKDITAAIDPKAALRRGGNDANHLKKEIFESQGSVKGAAYVTALITRLSEIGGVVGAHLYDAQPMISPFCAICDRFGKPQKPFYALRAFGQLYRAGAQVLCRTEQNEGFAHNGIYSMAAINGNGEAYVLVSSFGGCGVVDLRIDGISNDVYSADVYLLDGVKDMELGTSVPLSGMKKRLIINLSEYGVALIKLY